MHNYSHPYTKSISYLLSTKQNPATDPSFSSTSPTSLYTVWAIVSTKILKSLLLARDPLPRPRAKGLCPPPPDPQPHAVFFGSAVRKTVPGGQSEWESEETRGEREEEIKRAAGEQLWIRISEMRWNPLDWKYIYYSNKHMKTHMRTSFIHLLCITTGWDLFSSLPVIILNTLGHFTLVNLIKIPSPFKSIWLHEFLMMDVELVNLPYMCFIHLIHHCTSNLI